VFSSLGALVAWRGASLDGDLIMRVPRCLMSFAWARRYGAGAGAHAHWRHVSRSAFS